MNAKDLLNQHSNQTRASHYQQAARSAIAGDGAILPTTYQGYNRSKGGHQTQQLGSDPVVVSRPITSGALGVGDSVLTKGRAFDGIPYKPLEEEPVSVAKIEAGAIALTGFGVVTDKMVDYLAQTNNRDSKRWKQAKNSGSAVPVLTKKFRLLFIREPLQDFTTEDISRLKAFQGGGGIILAATGYDNNSRLRLNALMEELDSPLRCINPNSGRLQEPEGLLPADFRGITQLFGQALLNFSIGNEPGEITGGTRLSWIPASYTIQNREIPWLSYHEESRTVLGVNPLLYPEIILQPPDGGVADALNNDLCKALLEVRW